MAFPMLDQQIRPTRRPAIRAAHGVARTLSVAAALLLPLAASAADPIDDALEQCLKTPRGETTAGMTECTHAAYQAYDRQMNTLYQAVMSKSDPVSREAIRNAQRAWLAYRNAIETPRRRPTTRRGGQTPARWRAPISKA